MASGGSIDFVTIAGRDFNVPADSSHNRKLGGKKSERKTNGNGTSRNIQTREPWELKFEVEIDDDKGDQEFLQDTINQGVDVTVLVKYLNGVTYQGTGSIVGDIPDADMADAKMSVTMSGGGELVKI